MTTLLNATLTAPLTNSVTTPVQLRPVQGAIAQSATIQANFTYGSSGTTADVYVQTSFDEGSTWQDVANFHFTTSSLRVWQTVIASTAVLTATTAKDGTLTANTAVSGAFGNLWRCKTTSVGTYAGGTTLRVDINGIGFTAS